MSRSALPTFGSSPRVRGKPAGPLDRPPTLGLIPACAGKTARAACGTPASRAHPRVCGENPNARSYSARLMGSSPRVRGKRGRRQGHRRPGGLIPACAGKTALLRMAFDSPWAHPRVCGENHRRSARNGVAGGSSPRVRGKPIHVTELTLCRGLIPACAGKTKSERRSPPTSRAHPRVCGENSMYRQPAWSQPGSSPRVRGKQST